MGVNAPILEARNVSVTFGGVRALENVSLSVRPNEVLGIIGPNGAGKSTLFNVLSGFLPPAEGALCFSGMDISHMRPDERCRLGLARTWQTPRPFGSLTVFENVAVAAIAQDGTLAEARSRVAATLFELGLEDLADDRTLDLPLALKRRVEIARALVGSPKILLLDEVLAGLTALEIESLFEILQGRVARDGIAIILIEHVIRAVRVLCERVIVLSEGRIISEGVPSVVMTRAEVVEAYLGSAAYE